MGCCNNKDNDLHKFNMNFSSTNLRTSRVLQTNLNEKDNTNDDKARDEYSLRNTKTLNWNSSVMTVSSSKINEKTSGLVVNNEQNICEVEIKKANNHNEEQTLLQANQITFDAIESNQYKYQYQTKSNDQEISLPKMIIYENKQNENEMLVPKIDHSSKVIADKKWQCNDKETLKKNVLENKRNVGKSLSQHNSVTSSPTIPKKDQIFHSYMSECGSVRSERQNFHDEKPIYTSRYKTQRELMLENDIIFSKKFANQDKVKRTSLKNPALFRKIDNGKERRSRPGGMPLPQRNNSPHLIKMKSLPSPFISAMNDPYNMIKAAQNISNKTSARNSRPPYDSKILGKYGHLFTDSLKQPAKSRQVSNRHYERHLVDTEGDITNLKNRTASNSLNYSMYQSGHTSFWNNRKNITDVNLISIPQYTCSNNNETDTINN